MSVLPRISGRTAAAAFRKMGYIFGSHMIFRHSDPPHRRLVIPDHQELATGTLRSLIREAGITVEHFRNLL